MVDICRETHERNDVETVDKNGILQIHEKHVDEGLDHKKLSESQLRYLSDHRKHRYELADESKSNPKGLLQKKS